MHAPPLRCAPTSALYFLTVTIDATRITHTRLAAATQAASTSLAVDAVYICPQVSCRCHLQPRERGLHVAQRLISTWATTTSRLRFVLFDDYELFGWVLDSDNAVGCTRGGAARRQGGRQVKMRGLCESTKGRCVRFAALSC